MKSRLLLALLALALAMIALRFLALPEPAPATPPAIPPAAAEPEPSAPPPPQPVGDSCHLACAGGGAVEITCAAGETPHCDCQGILKTQCLPAAP